MSGFPKAVATAEAIVTRAVNAFDTALAWAHAHSKTMIALMIGIALLLMLAGCSDPEGATQDAEAFGFSNVQTQGHAWTGCSDKDTYATKFTADNARGDRVEGVACSGAGWGKMGTIRIGRIIQRADVQPVANPMSVLHN